MWKTMKSHDHNMAARAFQNLPIFSLKNMSNLVLSFHLLIFLLTLLVAMLDMFVIDQKKPPSMHKFGGRWRFLTVWNLDIQLIFFGLSLVHDGLKRLKQPFEQLKEIKLQQLVSTVYAAVVFPLGVFVSVTFWALYAVDRELVFPRVMDQYVPSWVNHCLHTNIVLYILLEMWLVRHEFPSVRRGLIIVTMFVAAYFSWVHFLYYMSGGWVYPVLQKLPFLQRYIFMIAVTVSIYPIYLAGFWLHRKRWGHDATTAKMSTC